MTLQLLLCIVKGTKYNELLVAQNAKTYFLVKKTYLKQSKENKADNHICCCCYFLKTTTLDIQCECYHHETILAKTLFLNT